MRLQTSYFDDPEEERRFNLQQMERFANGGQDAQPNPIHAALDMYGQDDQQAMFDAERNAPPSPDAERAAPVLEGRTQNQGPTARELEDDAMRAVRDSYGQKDSLFSQGAPAAIAVGLDALLNKGRDIGTIVGGYAQGRQRKESDDKSSMRQMAELEIQRARETQHDKERADISEINKGNLTARNAENDLARERFRATQGDPATDRKLKEAQTNNLEAEAYGRWTGDDKAITPYQQAQLDAQKDYRDEMNKDRDASRGDAKLAREESAATRKTLAEGTALTKKETNDRHATETFLGKTKDERSQASMLQGIEKVVDDPKYSNDLPGVGKLDSSMPAWLMHPIDETARNDANKMKDMIGQATAYFNHEITGAASSDRERAMNQALKALGGNEHEVRTALQVWKQDLQGKLRAQASASPDNARNALDAQGLGDWALGPPARPQAVAPPPMAAPQQVADDGPLPPDRITSGPPFRGTQGFPGSAQPSKVYQGPTQPQDSPAIDNYLQDLQKVTRTPGVRYRR